MRAGFVRADCIQPQATDAVAVGRVALLPGGQQVGPTEGDPLARAVHDDEDTEALAVRLPLQHTAVHAVERWLIRETAESDDVAARRQRAR
jgi:hypothetical protein